MGSVGVLDFIVRRPRDADLARPARRPRAAPRWRWPRSRGARRCSRSTSTPGRPRRRSSAPRSRCAARAVRLGLELRQALGLEGSRSTCRSTPRSTTRTKSYARAVAQALERSEPDLVVSQRRSCARARCWSTGARTTTRRPRSPSTLAALPGAPVGVDPVALGGGRAARRRRRPRVGALRGSGGASGWPSTATCSRPVLELEGAPDFPDAEDVDEAGRLDRNASRRVGRRRSEPAAAASRRTPSTSWSGSR